MHAYYIQNITLGWFTEYAYSLSTSVLTKFCDADNKTHQFSIGVRNIMEDFETERLKVDVEMLFIYHLINNFLNQS